MIRNYLKISVILATLLIIGGFNQNLFAQENEEKILPEIDTYLLWGLGDLIKSRDPRPNNHQTWKHEWIYELIAGVAIYTTPVENLRLTVNLEIGTYNTFPRNPFGQDGENEQDTRYDTYIEEAKGIYTLGEEKPKAFTIEFGHFLNRYNNSSRVFGEYLFRTLIYPAIIFNNFDYPWYPLSGVKIGHDFTDSFHHEIFLLTETDHYPYFDFSVAYMASYKFLNIFEVGGGINFHRLLPVRPSLTTPKQPFNTYVKVPAQAGINILDDSGLVIGTMNIDSPQEGFLDGSNNRRQALPDSLVDGFNYHPVGITGDSTVFSFGGTVIMGRFSFFPLALTDNTELAKMLSVYNETALLGFKNYPGAYDNRNERIPYMAGIQFSLPGIIDVLAFEVEHFGSKEVPSFWYRAHNNLPLPGVNQDYVAINDSAGVVNESARLTKDDWKWMFYARKQFKGFGLALQVGTDHMRREIGEFGIRYDEILTRPSQWYWQLRVRIPH